MVINEISDHDEMCRQADGPVWNTILGSNSFLIDMSNYTSQHLYFVIFILVPPVINETIANPVNYQ